ncbi:MAG: tRNA lysidine(34) synthetase TilS [Bacilli bacterium]|nr:tRNA lysidine(34) synthetase TilS [Bacilli bacterium]MDD4547289.1 tRNA lysidine(34) synthetase TilS [Bacilli bacterium]
MENAYNYLMNEVKIKYGDAIVVGVSGGPDSMALLHLLSRIKKSLDIQVICAHVHHNLRKESDDEKIFVERFCANHGIVFEWHKIEDYGDDNFHNEARSIRYNYFSKIVKKYNAKYLLTAHHGDDLIETILMRIVRGSTLRGYSGFSKVVKMDNYTIIRPLINVTKQEIYEYNKKNKINYVTDDSNVKDVYTRNRFRKYIVPEFKKEDEKVHEKFYKFSTTLLEYNNYIDKIVEEKLKKIYIQNIMNIEEFLKEEKVIQMKIIYYILEQIYQDDLMLITDQHVKLIHNLIHSKRANVKIHLPNNIKAIKSYDTFTLVLEETKNNEYEIELINYMNLPNGHNIEIIEETTSDSNFYCRLNSSEITLPLHVRTRQNGDKMYVKGMLGRKKINDIFIDEKVSIEERNSWPVVVDSAGVIVWLPGLKKSKFDKLKNEKYDIIIKYY